MIERVIENWLDSTTEREYEIPFSQILLSKGYQIVQRSTHGPGEHGKDLVCLDKAGVYHAYQLKTGNLNLEYWRRIRGEVEELVMLPIQHPGVPEETNFKAYLVTNGNLSTDVKNQIIALNGTWSTKYGRTLEILQRDYLLAELVKLHGTMLPVTPTDFERFLRLFLADRKEGLEKPQFAQFLEGFLPLDSEIPRAQLRRTFASSAVLGSYILSEFARARNHYALAEGWIILITYLLLLAEPLKAYEPVWRRSLDICVEAWESAAENLAKEALASQDWSEGDLLTDAIVHSNRCVMLAGYLACYGMYLRKKNRDRELQDALYLRVTKAVRAKQLSFWGESASPFFFSVILFLLTRGDEGLACDLAASVVSMIGRGNRQGQMPGVPDPYCSPEQIVRHFILGQQIFGDRLTFAGRSYTLRIFVEFLARRERKRTLKLLWYDVTAVDSAQLIFANPKDFYRWRVKEATLTVRRWKQPQQWEELAQQASADPPKATLFATKYPALLLPFTMTYPHRLEPGIAKLVEDTHLG